jgi:hypothetical protein
MKKTGQELHWVFILSLVGKDLKISQLIQSKERQRIDNNISENPYSFIRTV